MTEIRKPRKVDPFISHIDALKLRYGWTETALAENLGLAQKQHLSKIRIGDRPVPLAAKIRAWDLLGYDFSRDAILSMLPDQFARRIGKKSSHETATSLQI